MKTIYSLLALLCIASLSNAQLTVNASASNNNICLGNASTLTAVAAPIGYSVAAITTAPLPAPGTNVLAQNGVIGSTPLSTGNLDDGRWDNISLPFTFRFFGNVFNSINISTNGWVGLGSTNSTTTGLYVSIPTASAPNDVIHAITSDLTFGGVSNTSRLEYFVQGVPPNRTFTIHFGDLKFLSATGTATVQVMLSETTNAIEIHTVSCTNTSLYKTQGIEDNTGTFGYGITGRNNVQNWGITGGSSSYRLTPDNITYSWSPGATLNTTTGALVIARPTVNTTYTVTALNTVSSETATNTVTVNVNPSSYTLAGTPGGSAVCQNISVSTQGTYYRDGACRLIARLLPSGASPLSNSVNTCTLVDTGALKRGSADLYVARKFDIEPIINPSTSTATLSLYYLQSEFDNFNRKALDSGHYALPTGPADAAAINRLRLHQFHGTGTNPQNYTGGLEIFSTATSGFTVAWNSTNLWWEVTVPVNGFSGFYLTSEKLAPMPVKLNYFKGSVQGTKHLLNWKVTCTSTEAKFVVERSGDGQNFTPITTIVADQARCAQPFDFTDNATLAGKNYYRINMIDIDGKSAYSNIVLLIQKEQSFEMISINPNVITENNANIKLRATENTNIIFVVTDATGKKLRQSAAAVIPGTNIISLNISGLSKGIYNVTAHVAGSLPQSLQFIKK